MSTLRFKALETLPFKDFRKDNSVEIPTKLSELFCENVFSENTMREYLTKEAFQSIMDAIKKGTKIQRLIADQVAVAMKDWAMSKGVTHYTHWFQPLTGTTAEKHDSFFTPIEGGRAIERFSGNLLIQQEPDASSFPNGGIRNTFEARGYTAWDPTSPAFIMGTTLCIPSIFISYTGETLDYKAPLLRALNAVDEAATNVMQYFDKNVTKVTPTLGWEQEYFLVDSALYQSRPDLVLTGKTLLGHSPAKGQQLDDHYFGSIPTRVMNFMKELEIECMKLGIPVTTRHNEVAPNQFELAPMFEEVNVAVDHNSLLMDVMARIAHRHHFHILFHEKPFAGVNGSGKHNNWSLATDTGENLLSPGKNPKKNLQFLTFFVNAIKAVHEYADLLRASIASASNDHRLGANEAPPAIISVFIGSQLFRVLEELEKVTEGKLSPDEKTDLKLNVVGKIPEILLDNTDRNRTSPFAFTGNKFEIRAVGSSANCAESMTVMNTIAAKQLNDFKIEVDALIETGLKKDEAIFNVLREYIKQCKNIMFEGDGYSDDWAVEAEKRGLNNWKTTPEALKQEMNQKFVDLYEELGIFNHREVEARNEIKLEKYSTVIDIEARVLSDIARNHIIPSALKYQNRLIENVKGLKEIFGDKEFKTLAKEQMSLITNISENVSTIKVGVEDLLKARDAAKAVKESQTQAEDYCNKVKPLFDIIRDASDDLEMMVDDELWPMTKYREMLFTR
ncbi:glutamine synthetase III [Chryseobacterium sp. Ch-15]|uniref:Glutamine synthetase III n=1 Tax=Chryseobacterium muglaense TaxID=2893752 RepID=A0A9Q3YVV2_9FLAO|nr:MULTISPECIES: glutamine synthetase III [Chryseobacterium]MBD3905053.1 glutamine synthetase III [Chryseobacterium muglaense]MBO6185249.1 glutamine synthetase III [Chryseobacterium sp.]MCC9035080.1 glutamine synthetase III [Chryseobacterium muglaense]MCM2554579.1 glutamine synthetase III [Chryseobacterium muglaense]